MRLGYQVWRVCRCCRGVRIRTFDLMTTGAAVSTVRYNRTKFIASLHNVTAANARILNRECGRGFLSVDCRCRRTPVARSGAKTRMQCRSKAIRIRSFRPELSGAEASWG